MKYMFLMAWIKILIITCGSWQDCDKCFRSLREEIKSTISVKESATVTLYYTITFLYIDDRLVWSYASSSYAYIYIYEKQTVNIN